MEHPTSEDHAPRISGLALREIPESECLILLGAKDLGRLAVLRSGRPEIFPVNYVLDGRTVAFRTGPGTKLDWASLGPVAFEVDDLDPFTHEGWVVEVRGVGRDVTDGVDDLSTRLRKLPLTPWVEGEKNHWIAISSPAYSGRRLVRGVDEPA